MKYVLSTLLCQFLAVIAFGQINIQDSTFQVITYWDLGEKQAYNVSLEKLKIKGTDTLASELMTYEVEVTVKDSSENGYIVEWNYFNFKTNATDSFTQKIISASDDIKVDLEISELGVIQGVKNWEEVRDYMQDGIDTIKAEFKDIPNLDKVFGQLEKMYSTKTQVEATAIKDAHQFHNFHGAIYTLNEVLEGTLKTPNVYYPNKPFDTKVSVVLDEIDVEHNDAVLRMTNEVDQEQLTATTFDYIQELAKNAGGESFKKEDLKEIQNITYTASRIHASGWVIYSVLTKEIKTDGILTVEERILELK